MKRRFTARRLVVCSLLVTSLSAIAQAEATHQHRGTATVDGIDSPAEWAGAAAGSADMTLPAELGGGGGLVTFYVMNDDVNLYVAMRFPYALAPASPQYLVMLAQVWNDGLSLCAPTTVQEVFDLQAQNGGATYSDEFDVACAGGLPDVSDGGTSDGAAAMVDEGATLYFETSHPLDTADDSHDMSTAPARWIRMAVNSAGCGASDCGSPAHLIRRVFLVPGNLVFVGDFEVGDTSEWSSAIP